MRPRTIARAVCRRRGHRIVQQQHTGPDAQLVLLCTRCGLREHHPVRRLNRAERRAARKAA